MTAAKEIVNRLHAVFGEPNTPDPETFLVEYVKALQGYDANVLHKAADRVIRNATFWPRPGELLEHVRNVATELYAARQAAEHKPIEDRVEPTPEQKARVQAMLNVVMAKIKKDTAENRSETEWEDGQGPSFEMMQETSPNDHLHRVRSLSPTSRRVTGERD